MKENPTECLDCGHGPNSHRKNCCLRPECDCSGWQPDDETTPATLNPLGESDHGII